MSHNKYVAVVAIILIYNLYNYIYCIFFVYGHAKNLYYGEHANDMDWKTKFIYN